MLDLFVLQTSSANPTLISVTYAVLLSFLLSTLIAVTYEKTFRGLSYSRNFLQALVLGSIVAATVMQAIGDSLAIGIGMLGALAIIRFRTGLRDPRDIIFIFASLASGIACGVGGYGIALVGTLMFCIVAFVLFWSPFGTGSQYDGMLRFNAGTDFQQQTNIRKILDKHCRVFALITLREMSQGKRLDYAYHLKFKKKSDRASLVTALKTLPSIEGVNLMLQESNVEI